jgi:hypothetical protein
MELYIRFANKRGSKNSTCSNIYIYIMAILSAMHLCFPFNKWDDYFCCCSYPHYHGYKLLNWNFSQSYFLFHPFISWVWGARENPA